MTASASIPSSLIAPAESLNSLPAKLNQLITEASLINFGYTEDGANISSPKESASQPSSPLSYDVWKQLPIVAIQHLRTFVGSKFVPIDGTGDVLTNSTGGTRSEGDVVGYNSSTGDRSFNADPNATANDFPMGVVEDNSIVNAVSGLVQFGGYVDNIKITGSITRGNFIGKNTGSTAYRGVDRGVPSAATGLNSMGIALESGTNAAIRAWIWPFKG